MVLLHFLKTELFCIVINYVNSELRQRIVLLSKGIGRGIFLGFV